MTDRREGISCTHCSTDFDFMNTIPYTPRYKLILALSHKIAREYGHNYVGPEHMLLAMLRHNEGAPRAVWNAWHITEDLAASAMKVQKTSVTTEERLRAEIDAMKQKIADMEDILSNIGYEPRDCGEKLKP